MSSCYPPGRRRRVLMLSQALFLPSLAMAQSGPPVSQLSEITVLGEKLDSVVTEGSNQYTAPAVTIGKATRSIREVPQSVSVMTRHRMDEQNVQTLGEALEQTTGITVQDTNNYERSFYSRGYQIQTIQYDGVPTQLGSGFVTQPDMAVYDRVEVLRGPAGLFNGAGQPGGTVNLVRKRPTQDFALGAGVSAGSWNNYRADVDIGGPLNESGSLRGRLVGAYQDRDYFYDVANTKKSVLYGVVEYDLAPRTTVGVGASYEMNDMVPAYGGVPRYSDGSDLGLPRDTNLNAAWSDTRFERTSLFADITHRFNDDWRVRLGLNHTREHGHDVTGSTWGTVDPVSLSGPTMSAFTQRFDSAQMAIDGTLEGAFSALGKRHEFMVGANYWDRSYDAVSRTHAVTNSAVDVFDFNPYDYSDFSTTNPTARASNNRTNTEQLGLFGSLRLSLLDSVKLTLGGRTSYYRNSQLSRLTGQTTNRSKENGEFTPYGALTWDLSPQWTAYASYAEIFSSQANRYTAQGEPLDPVVGSSYEAGVKADLFDGRVNTSLAAFRITEENRAQVDPAFPQPCAGSPTAGACYVADGKVRSQGLEAEMNGALTRAWNLYAGYTFNTTKYLKDSTATGEPSSNERQPYSTFTPKHIFRLWTAYRLPGNLQDISLAGGVRVQSRTYKTSGNISLEQGMYAVWDARVSYRINQNVTAALNLNNIFDKQYYRTLGSVSSGNWYGDPRSVMLSLQARY